MAVELSAFEKGETSHCLPFGETLFCIKTAQGQGDMAEEFVKIATIDNDIEALLIESILKDINIPHQMRSYHDTAYDGLFQTQKGWGHISAPKQYADEINEILSDIRKKAQEEEGV